MARKTVVFIVVVAWKDGKGVEIDEVYLTSDEANTRIKELRKTWVKDLAHILYIKREVK